MTEQQSSNTLLPCPFCGGKAGIHRSHDADGMLWVGVRCQGCGAASTQDWCSPGNDCPIFYEGIRNSWNRRPAHEPATVRPEDLAAALAHRACCGVEHDPAQGKLHGYCVVCGVPWPCDTAKHFLRPPPTEPAK